MIKILILLADNLYVPSSSFYTMNTLLTTTYKFNDIPVTYILYTLTCSQQAAAWMGCHESKSRLSTETWWSNRNSATSWNPLAAATCSYKQPLRNKTKVTLQLVATSNLGIK